MYVVQYIAYTHIAYVLATPTLIIFGVRSIFESIMSLA